MKVNWLKYLLIALLALFVVACGSSEPEAAEPTEAPASEPADEPEAEAEPEVEAEAEPEPEPTDEPEEEPAEASATITIWADDTRAPILSNLGADFQSEYGVALNVEQVADIRDQFVIAAPAGEGPDIIIGAHDWVGQLVASGLLAPIDLGDKAADFSDVSISAFTYEEEQYGMAYAVENLAFFYNQDMVDGAPTSWDEVMEVGGAMVDAGDATYAMALTGTTYDAFPLQTAFGGYVFGRDAAGNYNPADVGIDSDGMIAAGEFVADSIAAGYLSDNTDWDTAHALFETGEMPFIMAGPWALDRFRESGVNYGIANFPDGGQSFSGVQGFMVNALSDNILLAQAFLTEFVATTDVMAELAAAGNRPSAFTPVTNDDADLVSFAEAGADAQPMPAIPEMGSVWGSWGDAFTLIINGDESADAALTNGAAQIRDLIGGSAAGLVNIPGSWQKAAGFDCEWDPACADTALSDNGDGTFSATHSIPAGEYEVKVALDGAWTENYGVDGAADGDNIPLVVPEDAAVTFVWDSESKVLDISQDPSAFDGSMIGAMDEGTMEEDGEMMEEGCKEDLTGEEIVIYQQAGREGPLAAILGDGFALATADGVAHLNENGGICGAEIVVEFCETNYDPEKEVACYTGFSEADPKPIILLTYGSGATIALKDRVVEDQIINFAAGLNADAFYNPANGYTFGAAPIYSDQFAGFIEYLSQNWADVKPESAGDEIVVGVIGWANSFGAGATTDAAIAYAESLGVTVLPLEEQAISPDADVSGAMQNLLLSGANVIYSQNLSFGTTQVIGTARALGVWDDVIIGGVNWSFNTDVLAFLGENTAAANGYYGVFPYLWWDDVDNPTVALANELFDAGGYGPDARNTTYLTTLSTFVNITTILEATINEVGFENLTGEAVLAQMEAMGTISDGVLTIDAADGRRASSMAQIRQWTWNGESMEYTVVQDFAPLPDTRP